jgi:RNA polymerase sigma factor (sigma-70 family)
VVATRELFRHRRKVVRERDRWTAVAEGATQAAPYDAASDRADLLAALRELPDRQRSMVVARYYYGLSYDEIAAEFGVRGGTVGATLHQALDTLRQLQVAGKLARGSMA